MLRLDLGEKGHSSAVSSNTERANVLQCFLFDSISMNYEIALSISITTNSFILWNADELLRRIDLGS